MNAKFSGIATYVEAMALLLTLKQSFFAAIQLIPLEEKCIQFLFLCKP